MTTHEPSLSNHHSNMVLEGKKMESRLLDMSYINMGGVRVYEDIAPTLTSRDYKEPRMVLEREEMNKDNTNINQIPSLMNYKRIEKTNTEIAMTVTAREYKGFGTGRDCQNGVIEIKQNTKEGSIKCKVGGCFDASFPESTTRRGRVQNDGDIVPTLTSVGSENIYAVETEYRIRKLTPKECWRIMGYKDKDYEEASKVVSNTQLYKQAGNAIVKQVLMAIFLQMGIQGKKKWNDMTEEERQELIKGSIK